MHICQTGCCLFNSLLKLAEQPQVNFAVASFDLNGVNSGTACSAARPLYSWFLRVRQQQALGGISLQDSQLLHC